MNNKDLLILSSLLISVLPNTALAKDIQINGFGSVVGASVIDGDGYIAEYMNLATYEDDDLDFGQETRVGLQITGEINEKMSATTQLLFRASNDFDAEVAWAFLSYDVLDDTTLQVGRLRAPVYHFSEFMDVGYAYPWLRIPADTYSLDITSYNGLRLMNSFSVGDHSLDLSLMYGQEKNENSELMSYLFPNQVDREFENLVGAVLQYDMDNISLRSSYVQGDLSETRHLSAELAGILGLPNTVPSNIGKTDQTGAPLVSADTDYDISFFDASVKAELGNVKFIAEYNKYKPFYISYFGSLSYTIDEYELYILYSKFDLDEAWESHDTQSIGLRWDFMPNVAFKLDLSQFDDTGYNPFSGAPNPVFKGDPDNDGDVTVLSAGFDFIF